ncbi:hypothetical protein EON66_11085 [archaeon]|nr:MAG: hypothetical protein EON66_11085 [archaeon]
MMGCPEMGKDDEMERTNAAAPRGVMSPPHWPPLLSTLPYAVYQLRSSAEGEDCAALMGVDVLCEATVNAAQAKEHSRSALTA